MLYVHQSLGGRMSDTGPAKAVAASKAAPQVSDLETGLDSHVVRHEFTAAAEQAGLTGPRDTLAPSPDQLAQATAARDVGNYGANAAIAGSDPFSTALRSTLDNGPQPGVREGGGTLDARPNLLDFFDDGTISDVLPPDLGPTLDPWIDPNGVPDWKKQPGFERSGEAAATGFVAVAEKLGEAWLGVAGPRLLTMIDPSGHLAEQVPKTMAGIAQANELRKPVADAMLEYPIFGYSPLGLAYQYTDLEKMQEVGEVAGDFPLAGTALRTAGKVAKKLPEAASAARSTARRMDPARVKQPLTADELLDTDAVIAREARLAADNPGVDIIPDEVQGVRPHTTTAGADPSVVPPRAKIPKKDLVPQTLRHEVDGHVKDLGDSANRERVLRTNDVEQRIADGTDFATMEGPTKLGYHRDQDFFERIQLDRDVENASVRLADPDISPEEARFWEENLARSAHQRDRLDVRATARLDEHGKLQVDDPDGLLEAGWFDHPTDLELPQGKDTHYQKFINATKEEQAAIKVEIDDAIQLGDWEKLHEHGYREINGVVTRPQGLTGEFPGVRKIADGVYDTADVGGHKLDIHANPGASIDTRTPLDMDAPSSTELNHSKNQTASLKARLGINDQQAELTIRQIVDARNKAWDVKRTTRALNEAERTELDRLRKLPGQDLTPDERAVLGNLDGRSGTLSRAHADMVAASEMLGDEAAAAIMKKKGANMEMIDSGTGNGTFDQIWMDRSTDPPKIYIVEAKGGGAKNSSSRLTADGQRAQQGSKEYKESVWKVQKRKMATQQESLFDQAAAAKASGDHAKAEKLGAEAERLLADIERIDIAIVNNKDEYLMISQKFDGRTLGKAGEQTFQ